MKKVIVGSMALGMMLSNALAFDYKVSGEVGTFSKWGFNNQAIDTAKNQYPTESFTSLVGGAKVDATIIENLKVGIGGMIGGLMYDSTNAYNGDGAKVGFQDRKLYSLNTSNGYIGVNVDKGKVQNYVLYNAYAGYDNGTFGIKAGRYESGNVGYYFSGFNQGAEAYAKLGDVKVWGFYSDARGFAYSSWMYEFYHVGNRSGLLGGGAEFEHNGLKLGAFVYGKNKTFTAPGFIAGFDTSKYFGSEGLNSATRLIGLFPQANSSKVDGGVTATNWGAVERSSYSLYLEQKFTYSKFNFGGGIYYNSGNANGQIGTFGNPLMLDFWTTSMYDIGGAISDMVGKDAFTPFVFGGASYGKLDWTLILRHTNAARSTEESAGLLINYKLRDDVSIGGKIEYLNDVTKAGYKVGEGGLQPGTERRSDDRSHAFFYVQHNF